MEEIEIVRVKFTRVCSGFGCTVFSFESADNKLNIGDFCVTYDPEEDDDLSLGEVISKYKIPKQKSLKSIQKILRKATDDDIKTFNYIRHKEEEAHDICRKKIKDRGLPMKLIKTQYAFDGSKVTFYFSSEKRVDFRDLVKDLAYIFKCRIELRQVGVRDEAKIMGGYGYCGHELCCCVFLKRLGKLRIKMAREQNMTLTPSKISGICGRLLCCLEYESEWYHEIREKIPRIGSNIRTGNIKGRIEDIDIFRGIIKVRDDNGRLIEVMPNDI